MADVAELGLKITTDGAEKAERDLSELERAALRLAKAADQMEQQVGEANEEVKKASGAAKEAGGFWSGMADGVFKGLVAYDLAGKAVNLLTSTIEAGIRAVAEYELATVKLDQSFRTVGNATGFTREALQDFASDLESSTGTAEEQILRVIQIINRLGRVSGQDFKDVTQLALDMGAAMGTDVVTAAETLTRALGAVAVGDLDRGFGQLRRQFEFFTPEVERSIKTLYDQRGALAAVNGVVDLMNSKIGGGAAAQSQTLTGAWNRLTDATNDAARKFFETTGIAKGLTDAIDATAEGINNFSKEVDDSESSAVAWSGAINVASAATRFFRGDLWGAYQTLRLFNDEMRKAAAAPAIQNRGLVDGDFLSKSLAQGRALIQQKQLEKEAADKNAAAIEDENLAIGDQQELLKLDERQRRVVIGMREYETKLNQQGIMDEGARATLREKYRKTLEQEVALEERKNKSSGGRASALDREAHALERVQQELDDYIDDLDRELELMNSSEADRDAMNARLRVEEIARKSTSAAIRDQASAYADMAEAKSRAISAGNFFKDIEEETQRLRDEVTMLGLADDARADYVDRLEIERHAKEAGLSVDDAKVQGYIAERNALRLVIEEQKQHEEAVKSVTSAFTDFATSVIDGSDDIVSALGKLLLKLLEIEIQMQLMKGSGGDLFSGGGILGSIFGLFGGGGGGGAFGIPADVPLARGGAFEGGVKAMASGGMRGGITKRATMMPMALIGEEEPEAVMPLSRDANGELGVKVKGGGGQGGPRTVVQIIDQRKSGAAVEKQQSMGPNGEDMIRLFIRDEVKRAVGDGDMDSSFQKNFNLTRAPTRRS